MVAGQKISLQLPAKRPPYLFGLGESAFAGSFSLESFPDFSEAVLPV